MVQIHEDTTIGIDVLDGFAIDAATIRIHYFQGDLSLLEITDDALSVTARGRLFVRTICMHFDRYLPAHAGQTVFSRTV